MFITSPACGGSRVRNRRAPRTTAVRGARPQQRRADQPADFLELDVVLRAAPLRPLFLTLRPDGLLHGCARRLASDLASRLAGRLANVPSRPCGVSGAHRPYDAPGSSTIIAHTSHRTQVSTRRAAGASTFPDRLTTHGPTTGSHVASAGQSGGARSDGRHRCGARLPMDGSGPAPGRTRATRTPAALSHAGGCNCVRPVKLDAVNIVEYHGRVWRTDAKRAA